MFESFIQILLDFSSQFGYLGVLFLMTVESSFIPFPSELVIPPAAYLAYQGEMNIFLVIFFGTFGSLIGALINYYLALFLGRPIIYSLTEKKWSKVFLINSKKVEKAEKYFLDYGEVSTFLGRLVPAVRQLISIPAGFTKMKLKPFMFFTTLGAGLWVSILAVFGYFFGAKEDLLKQYYGEIAWVFIVFFLLLLIFIYFKKKK